MVESLLEQVEPISEEQFYPLWLELERCIDDLMDRTGSYAMVHDRDEFNKEIDGKGFRFFGIADKAGIGFREIVKNDINALDINFLYVKPGYRNSGYGKILLDFVKEISIDEKRNNIRVGTPKQNEGAKRFYLDNGFVIVDNIEFPEAYAFDWENNVACIDRDGCL